jgi:hypothetical protein
MRGANVLESLAGRDRLESRLIFLADRHIAGGLDCAVV